VASFEDHYRPLGVHRHAEPTVLAAAYRALARQHHPDLNPSIRSAQTRLKQINAAYEVLTDPAKRRAYDRKWDAH
jgi:molecular chaperone DnaJ